MYQSGQAQGCLCFLLSLLFIFGICMTIAAIMILAFSKSTNYVWEEDKTVEVVDTAMRGVGIGLILLGIALLTGGILLCIYTRRRIRRRREEAMAVTQARGGHPLVTGSSIPQTQPAAGTFQPQMSGASAAYTPYRPVSPRHVTSDGNRIDPPSYQEVTAYSNEEK